MILPYFLRKNRILTIFLFPTLTLIGLVVLFVFVFKVGFSQIRIQSLKIVSLSKEENLLFAKESLLREIQEAALSQAEVATRALPEKNPVISMISQLKNLAAEKGILLANLKVGNQSKDSQLSRILLDFDAEGSFLAVLGFVKSIENLSPISSIEKMKIVNSSGFTRASVSLRVYWSPFPTQIPSVAEPVRELSQEEKDLIIALAQLRQEQAIQVTALPPSARVDPFSP